MKRWFWVATGFGLGVAASRRARQRTHTEGRASRKGGVGAWLRAHVDDAVREGRQEAQRRERALRDVLAAPSDGAREPEK
jgi:hypothetical protein